MSKKKSRSLAESTLRSAATNGRGMTSALRRMTSVRATSAAALMLAGLAFPLSAQLGRQAGLVEPNVAADSQFTRLALSPHAVHLIGEAKPILSIVTLDSILGAAGMNAAQRKDMY